MGFTTSRVCVCVWGGGIVAKDTETKETALHNKLYHTSDQDGSFHTAQGAGRQDRTLWG